MNEIENSPRLSNGCSVCRDSTCHLWYDFKLVCWEGIMAENSQINSMGNSHGTPVDRLREEYKQQQTLFNAQPVIIQRFLETQARQIAEAFIERERNLRFTLPDRVITKPEAGSDPLPVSQSVRLQHIGSLRDRLEGRDVHLLLRQRLAELDQSLSLIHI